MSFITMFHSGLYLFFSFLVFSPKERLLRLVLQDSNLRTSLAQKPTSGRSDELLSTLRTLSDGAKNPPRRDVHVELCGIKNELSNLVLLLRLERKTHHDPDFFVEFPLFLAA